MVQNEKKTAITLWRYFANVFEMLIIFSVWSNGGLRSTDSTVGFYENWVRLYIGAFIWNETWKEYYFWGHIKYYVGVIARAQRNRFWFSFSHCLLGNNTPHEGKMEWRLQVSKFSPDIAINFSSDFFYYLSVQLIFSTFKRFNNSVTEKWF